MQRMLKLPEFGISDDGWRTLAHSEVANEADLIVFLQRAGVDPSKFGTGKAKTLASLIKEVDKGDSTLQWKEDTCSLRRIAEPLFIQFRQEDKVLVEVEQKFSDGRMRARNMLLAEKKSPEDVDVCAAAFRGLQEELDLPEDFRALQEVVGFMAECYNCVAESLESGSYPGLSCVYVTHFCGVQLLESGVPHFEALGLLNPDFETQEADKTNKWRWTPLSEARKAKVKGFPNMASPSPGKKADIDADYQPLPDLKLDVASLRVLDSKEFKVAMRDVGLGPKKEEIQTMTSDVDDSGSGTIGHQECLKMMAHKILNRDPNDEILKAFHLFDDDETGKHPSKHLKRVAKELSERMTGEELQEIIDEAVRDGDGEVNDKEFLRIMQRPTCSELSAETRSTVAGQGQASA